MNILIIAPHPDDELLAAHELMRCWATNDNNLHVLLMTGDPVRQTEAAAYLVSEQPSASFSFAGLEDSKLFSRIPAVVHSIANTCKLHSIDLVIAPHWQEPMSITSDHLSCWLAAQFVKVTKRYYVLWGHVRPGHLPQPRNRWRAFKWRLRSLLPEPTPVLMVQLTPDQQSLKAAALYKYYPSQSHLPPAFVQLACSQETLYNGD